MQTFKDGDSLRQIFDAENKDEIIFITDKAQLYRAKVSDFDNVKASAMGEYIPAKLGMDSGEKPIFMNIQNTLRDGFNYVFIFENGKGVRIPEKAYETSGFRRKLKGACSTASPVVEIFSEEEKKPFELMLINSENRAIIIKTSLIVQKTTRTSIGSQIMTLKGNSKLTRALSDFESVFENTKGYRKLKLPATPVALTGKDAKEQQLSIDEI